MNSASNSLVREYLPIIFFRILTGQALFLSLIIGLNPSFAWYPTATVPSPRPSFEIRAFANNWTGWGWTGMESDSDHSERVKSFRNMLKYYGALKYSHFVFCQDLSFLNSIRRNDFGNFEYVHERGFGYPDSLFLEVWRESASRGLNIIPMISTLSHQSANIRWLDSTISEFPSSKSFEEYSKATGFPSDPNLNHVAAPLDNPGQDQLFRIKVEALLRNWIRATQDSNARPIYLALGHDEIGYDTVGFVKKGRSKNSSLSASQLIAKELELRILQIDSVMGNSATHVLIYGDSFLPTDIGERYGLFSYKDGGTLGYLAKWGYASRIIVIPWNYLQLDGEYHHWSRIRYQREPQLKFLDSLGFRYILGVGEHGSNGAEGEIGFTRAFALGNSERTKLAMLEWFQAADLHPRAAWGVMHHTFEPFEKCTRDSLCTGFSAPWPAHWEWGKRALGRGESLIGVKAAQSRRDLDWVQGVHFP
jgi:hypothetical protein